MLPIRLARAAMRTRFEVALWGDDPAHLRAAGEEALDEVTRVEGELSPYQPTSDVYAINALADQRPVRVLPTTLAFLARARDFSLATGGIFDPTVGPLLEIWGIWRSEGRTPSDAEVADALEKVGMGKVVALDMEAMTVSLTVPGARIHPGAIGKGWALDRAAALLRDQGIERALLHGGTSSVIAIGGPFPIEIASGGVVALENLALGVSGAHGKIIESGQRRIAHVIDPRSGQPVSCVGAAVALATNATAADALSTALLVCGRLKEMNHAEFIRGWAEPIS